ncbi:MAG: alpha-L-arabinofuranosidase [Bacteroidales bacterium]|nr:alpha-L-arabinofuranosidase [Bacteroidales bacterium]
MKRIIGNTLILLIGLVCFAQKQLTVQVNQPVAEIQPTMWGIFFEDINFGADGGIYAELIKNRSFEFYKPLMGWREIGRGRAGEVRIINRMDANPPNPRFARLICKTDTLSYGLSNEGFRGLGVKKDLPYHFSIIARVPENDKLRLKIELIDSVSKIIGNAVIEEFGTDWKKYQVTFISSATEPRAKLNLLVEGKGMLDIDMVSLFPDDTWKNRPNGLRADLVQMLYDLKPGFLRFPGGCIVEGHDLDVRYQWKKTIGPDEERELIVNRWNTEFMHKHTPDYFQSFGLGFYEYFLLSEDLGAEPLPIINCGMACQFNTGELVDLDQLEPFIQDALDLVEFANGPTTSKWGKKRAEMGHPEPFGLKYLGIGNEQWGEQYIERYKAIASVLKEKNPEIQLVAAAGPSPNDGRFHYLWKELKALNADLIDEHYYMNPNWFLDNARRYDNYDRKGPKVFAGEYASHGPSNDDPTSRNTWLSALTEAAFMTGLERNADVVYMTSYAPLFGHVNAWQWRPDLIWFDNLRVAGTPNYYVQKLFANYKGTHTVPILMNEKTIAGEDSLYASAVIDKKSGEVILKIVNTASVKSMLKIKLSGIKSLDKHAEIIRMHSNNLLEYNTLEEPAKISPMTGKLPLSGKTIELQADEKAFYVIKVKYK